MIDHIGFAVKDMDRAKAFYLAALKPLGNGVIREVTAEQAGGGVHAGFGKDNKAFFWNCLGREAQRRNPYRLHRPRARRRRRLLPRGVGRQRTGQRRARPQAPLS